MQVSTFSALQREVRERMVVSKMLEMIMLSVGESDCMTKLIMICDTMLGQRDKNKNAGMLEALSFILSYAVIRPFTM